MSYQRMQARRRSIQAGFLRPIIFVAIATTSNASAVTSTCMATLRDFCLRFEGATAEASPDTAATHPAAPVGARTRDDGYVHYIFDKASGTDAIRFWFPSKSAVGSLPVDYEILAPALLAAADDPDADERTRQLIVHVFFVEFVAGHYEHRVRSFSFRRLGASDAVDVAYPKLD